MTDVPPGAIDKIQRALDSAKGTGVKNPEVEFDRVLLQAVVDVYRRAGSEEQRQALVVAVWNEVRAALMGDEPPDQRIGRGQAAFALYDRMLGSTGKRLRPTDSGGYTAQ